MKSSLFILYALILFSSCNNNNAGDNKLNDLKDKIKSERPSLANHQSVGSLSFKLDGELFEADPAHAKAWTTVQIPLAMLMARNDKGLSVGMQIQNMHGEGEYKIDGDRKGNINFTVNGKTYWTRSVTGDNYLNLIVTSTKEQATVVLLSGTFEGILEDKDGNKVHITEGKFTTDKL
jgi:hypothetical protein